MTIEPVLVLPAGRTLGEGESRRFEVRIEGVRRDAFAVRWHGAVHAYVNACRHQAQPLDFGDGHFFDDAFDALVCCHHGARYAPDSGLCVQGPCAGKRLTRLVLESKDGALWCTAAAAAEP